MLSVHIGKVWHQKVNINIYITKTMKVPKVEETIIEIQRDDDHDEDDEGEDKDENEFPIIIIIIIKTKDIP